MTSAGDCSCWGNERAIAFPNLCDAARGTPQRSSLPTLLVYLGAAVLYIVVGVFLIDFMLSVVVAAAYLLLVTWLVPSAIRRLR